MPLRITMAFSDNPRVQPIKDGTVKPEHIELDIVTANLGTLFFRNLKYDEFDASEMSISESLLAHDRTDGNRWNWSAIPVFLSRGHFWAGLYVSVASGINGFGDLKGKRIGVPDYDMTAALWMRIVLKDLYGIEAADNIWYNGRTKELSQGTPLGLDQDGPRGVTIEWLNDRQTLDQMLDQGEIDAAIIRPQTALAPGHTVVVDRYGGTPLTGNPHIRRLADDGGQGIITEYFRKTGVHMVNHHVIVQNRILKEHPWVAMDLFKTLQRSKEVAYQRARQERGSYLYFDGNDLGQQAEVFGSDPYPLGLQAMGKTMERAVQGSLEQGLIRKPVLLSDIYHESTLGT